MATQDQTLLRIGTAADLAKSAHQHSIEAFRLRSAEAVTADDRLAALGHVTMAIEHLDRAYSTLAAARESLIPGPAAEGA